MRRTGKAIGTLAAATSLVMLGSSVALGDQVTNTIDISIDSTAETMPLNVGGSAGTTTIYIFEQDGDGRNNCNVNGGHQITVSFASSNTGVATVSPSSMTFSGCGSTNAQTLTVTPVAVGSTSITASGPSTSREGSMDYSTAAFDVTVAPPANTAPTVTVGGVVAGASYNKGSVPAATCNVVDTEDGNSSFAATLSPITGIYSADGVGNQTASCSYTDGGGLSATRSATYSIVDPSAPGISSTLVPPMPDGANGWYRGNVSLAWTVTEDESPTSLSKTGCVDRSITADQTETSYSCTATSAGGTSGPVSVSIKRDGTAPVVSGSDVNNTTWRNSSLEEVFTASDATSGLANPDDTSFTLTASLQSASSSLPTRVSKTVVDAAGNGTTRRVSAFIDLTKPDNAVTGVSDGATYTLGAVPSAGCSTTDALSGPASQATAMTTGSIGSVTTTCSGGADNAGNTANPVSVTYTVQVVSSALASPVDKAPWVNKAKVGRNVPLKWRVVDANGAGYSGLTSQQVQVRLDGSTACSNSSSTDEVEVYSTSTSALQNLGDGYYQIDWKTPSSTGCRLVTVVVPGGDGPVATFSFTK